MSILCLSLFLTTLAGPIYTIFSFYHNQAEIEALFCENKTKPELKCHGHCYLNKQLSNYSSIDIDQSPKTLKSAIFWSYAFQNLSPIKFEMVNDVDDRLAYDDGNNLYKRLFAEEILDPPRTAFHI